jgi:DNA-binding SARP family transcriptional activator
MPGLILTLLGGFQARLEPGGACRLPTRKAQALLAYLALPSGHAHPRDKLASLLWGGVSQESARASLRQALFALRTVLRPVEPPAIVQSADTLALDPRTVEVDVARFETLVRQDTPEALERAATLYQGDLLAGLAVDEAPFEEWLVSQRERLRELALEALARLLAHHRRHGALEPAVHAAIRLLALDPLQEPVHRALMRLYLGLGRRGAALRQYQHCVDVLRRELGLDPEPETKTLYQEILRHRPGSRPIAEVEHAVEAMATLPGPAPWKAWPQAEGPLIGRDDEMARLRSALARGGRRPGLAVLGEAGVGKTRVISALAAEAETAGMRVLLGRSHESEQVLPFAPWVDALRPARGDLTGLAPHWRAELARLIPEVAGPDAAPGAAVADSLQLFEAVLEALHHLGRQRPLLLALEDLHWADEMSARLLAFVGRRLAAEPVVIAMTAREEDLPDTPVLRHALEDLERQGELLVVRLGPLSRPDTLALVRVHARTGAEPAELAGLGDRAWLAGEGNPLVTVEVVRAHAEGGAPGHGAGLRLPERVRAIVLRRLERLSERARHLAAMAAVIGREFDFPLLQEATGAGEDEVAEGIEELVRRRILKAADDGFAFSHERIREVAYAELLGVRRRAMHGAVAGALERTHAAQLDGVYDRLAYHYLQADIPAKAADYLARFARKATRAYAHDDAVRAYEEALRQVERLPPLEADARRLDIVPRLTRSLMFLGRFEDARDLLLAQHDRVEALDNPSLSSQYQLLLAHVYAFLGDRDRAAESARLALAFADRAEDPATMGKAFYVLAMEGWWAGDPEQGIADGRRAIALLGPTPERWWLGQAHFAVAANHVLLGEFDAALEAAREAAVIGDAIGDPRVQTPAAWLAGTIHALRGEWDEGVAAGRRSLDYSPDPLNRADALGWCGLAYLEKGDPAGAIELLEQSVEHWSRFRVRSVQGGFRILLGHACLMQGDADRATKLAEEGLAHTRQTGYRLGVGWGERLLALIARRQGRSEEARSHLEQALATFTASHAGFEAARTRLLLGELYAELGDADAAAALLDEARQAFARLGIPKYARWAEWQAGQSRGSAAAPDTSRPERVPRWA